MTTKAFPRRSEAGAQPGPGYRDPLEEVSRPVERTFIVFGFPGDGEKRKVAVEFFGRFPGLALMVSAPFVGWHAWQDHLGLPIGVRLFTTRTLFAFEAALSNVLSAPKPHLVLTYPESVRAVPYRRGRRIEGAMPASVSIRGDRSYRCVVTDISRGGCGIGCNAPLGGIGDGLLLSFEPQAGRGGSLLTVPAIIRNSRMGRGGSHYGVEFDDTVLENDPRKAALLDNFVLDHLTAA